MKSLSHNGIFIATYNPLGLSITCRGKAIELSPEAEQAAIAWVRKLETPYVQDPIFVKNFTEDFSRLINMNALDLTEINFGAVAKYVQDVKSRTEAMTKEDKRTATRLKKDLREKLKEKYGFAEVDGVRTPIANWASEPASIFIAKGQNKLRGHWKKAITRSDVTVNTSDRNNEALAGFRLTWKPDEMWLAKWTSPLDQKVKYVWLSPSSSLRQEREQRKFELAEKLSDPQMSYKLEKYIMKGLDSGDAERSACATACYLIKTQGLRVGDEHLAGEFGTVGCTTLRREHIFINKTDVTLDFRGKDNVPWHRTFTVPQQVVDNLTKLLRNGNDTPFSGLNSNKDSNKDLTLECKCGVKSLCPSKILLKRKSMPENMSERDLVKIQNSIKSILKTQESGEILTRITLKTIQKLTMLVTAKTLSRKQNATIQNIQTLSASNGSTNVGKSLERGAENANNAENQISDFLTSIILYQNEKLIAKIGKLDQKSLSESCVSNVIAWFSGLNLRKDLVKNSGYIFNGLNSAKVSSFLRECIPGLSAKVFRTHLAGITLDKAISDVLPMIKADSTKDERKFAFKKANLEVAMKLNHKKTPPKNYPDRLQKAKDKVQETWTKLEGLKKDSANGDKIPKQKKLANKASMQFQLLRDTGEWNLSTSLNAYLDPNKVLKAVKDLGLEPKDVYSKAQIEKSSWAVKKNEA